MYTFVCVKLILLNLLQVILNSIIRLQASEKLNEGSQENVDEKNILKKLYGPLKGLQ